MKSTIRNILIVAVVALFATTAHAGRIVSYNRSVGMQIRTIAQWTFGIQRISSFTVESCVAGNKVFSLFDVTINHFTREVRVELVRSAVIGVCP